MNLDNPNVSNATNNPIPDHSALAAMTAWSPPNGTGTRNHMDRANKVATTLTDTKSVVTDSRNLALRCDVVVTEAKPQGLKPRNTSRRLSHG